MVNWRQRPGIAPEEQAENENDFESLWGAVQQNQLHLNETDQWADPESLGIIGWFNEDYECASLEFKYTKERKKLATLRLNERPIPLNLAECML